MSQGVAGAAIERPQRGERCIALWAIAARGEASPRVESVGRLSVLWCWCVGVDEVRVWGGRRVWWVKALRMFDKSRGVSISGRVFVPVLDYRRDAICLEHSDVGFYKADIWDES